MKNMAVLKQFSLNMALALGAFAVMWGAAMLSDRYLGESLYAFLALLIVFFVAMTWSMSASQVQSRQRELERQKESAERKHQRQMLME